MTELDEYKKDMQPDQPEPLCVRLCATVARLREENERLRGYERIWNETCLATANHNKGEQ